jgi:16S rRNA processing protein RimM
MSSVSENLLDCLDGGELPGDAIEVARLGEAWGVKGWIKVLAHSAHPEALFSSKRWYLQPPERGAHHFSGTRILPVSQIRRHGEALVVQSLSITDRTMAELLRGARVFVSRSLFPSLPDDEYYWVDLIGCEVVNREGVVLGVVEELLATGPQTTLVLKQAGQETSGGQRMIPFVNAFVDTVDVSAKRIVVNWQPDFWD